MPLTIRRRPPGGTPARVLLTSLEAADALGISERKLFDLTEPRGPIPCVRLGRLVRFRPSALEAWAKAAEDDGPVSPR